MDPRSPVKTSTSETPKSDSPSPPTTMMQDTFSENYSKMTESGN